MTSTAGRYLPSDRVKRIWHRVKAQPDEMFLPVFRSYYYLEGWMENKDQPFAGRVAAALCNVIENMPCLLTPGDILVGESGERQMDEIIETPYVNERMYDRIASSALTNDQKARMMSWLDEDPFAFQQLSPVAPDPPELQTASEHGAVAVWGVIHCHSIRDYAKVLRLGFNGIRAEVEAAISSLPLADPDAANRLGNLLAFKMLCESAAKIGRRHADEARRLALRCDDPDQKREWDKIAEICERVPAEPARNFREAVQSLWFAHIMTAWEDGINANGIGRIDQFLWPYLEADLAAGTITMPEAAEILAALWIKLYRPYDVQQMMIGGQLPDGTDATNPLSYLVLDVTEGLGFIRCLSARLHRGSPRELVSRCVDILSIGNGVPFFFNDEALIPALVSKGIPLEDARGYAAIGCIEITIPGKACPHAVSHWINLAKCLELAINDGRDLLDGVQVGPKTGTLADLKSMDDVLSAYKTQLEYFTELAVYGSNSLEVAGRSRYRLPYLSLLTDDCIARGSDIVEGAARYNYHSSAAMGIPNVADSLAALHKAVFTDKSVSPSDMLAALRENYAGREDLRLFLRNRLPKYGNDQTLPDSYAAELSRQYCELLGSYKTPSGGTFFCHLFTFQLMLSHGKLTGASPEGRLAGEPLAYSLSPAQGRDKEGLTAALMSLARIPHHLAAASSSAILEADPALLEGANREAFVDMLVTAIDQGVGQLQFNVANEETLRAAQDQPDLYSNLCVRVSGFSYQFCALDREMQNHIIARTKHTR